MELISKRGMPSDCNIYLTSDYHVGALNCSMGSLRQMVQIVADDPIGYMANGGDSIEAILPNDKRFASCSIDWETRSVTPEQQLNTLSAILSPIKEKILVVMMGNHEYKLINTFNAAKKLATDLGVSYGSAVCKLTLNFEDEKLSPIKFFLAHGSGTFRSNAKDSIQRTANIKAALKQKLQSLSADCIGMFVGHGHHLITVEPTAENELYLTDDGKNIHQHYRANQNQSSSYIPPDSRYYGMTGSFLRLFSPPGSEAVGYGEIALYAPAEIGCLVARIRGGQMVGLEKVVL